MDWDNPEQRLVALGLTEKIATGQAVVLKIDGVGYEAEILSVFTEDEMERSLDNQDYVWFAIDGLGSYFAMHLKAGSIWFEDHDSGNLYRLADTSDDFVRLLTHT